MIRGYGEKSCMSTTCYHREKCRELVAKRFKNPERIEAEAGEPSNLSDYHGSKCACPVHHRLSGRLHTFFVYIYNHGGSSFRRSASARRKHRQRIANTRRKPTTKPLKLAKETNLCHVIRAERYVGDIGIQALILAAVDEI